MGKHRLDTSNEATHEQAVQTQAEPDSQVIIVGAGLSGMVAAYEAVKSGLRVLVLDQENRNNLGGQAFWSLGGLFFVDSPEQRLMGIKDSEELAWRDWQNSAQYDDGPHDYWPRRWGREYVRFAANEKRQYVRDLGLRSLPTVGWAERGSGQAGGHGNSVPRFHVTWGTGPEVVRIFQEPLEEFERQGKIEFRFRHQVDEILTEDGPDGPRAVGVRGTRLAESNTERGVESNREAVGEFTLRATAVVVTTGGIGGNLDLVRKSWPTERWGEMPDNIVVGVPAHVDGRMLEISERAGASLVNTDRMWHYTEGMMNWDPIWPKHGIRIIPGPSALWLDATGKRMPSHIIPGGDTIATLEEIGKSGHGYTWFVLTQAIADKEFIFSGSEQNDDITIKTVKNLIQKVASKKTHYAVQNFMDHGEDWVIAEDLSTLVRGMNDLVGEENPQIDEDNLRGIIEDRDSQVDNPFSKDAQINYIRMARGYLGDKITRCEEPHKFLDPDKGPLIAIRIRLLTRKTLGGIETDLSGRCLRTDGTVFPGLYAAGEVAGFGGGGVHGKNALEGTFLGGCIHSGKRVGEALRAQVEKLENQKNEGQ